MSVVDQKRIAQNTLLLYIRMGVIVVISFYTSRVALDYLGVVDSGLYGAVGGIVIAFSFLNGVLSAACNRYFSIEIGRGDNDALHKVFCLNVTAFLFFTLLVLVLAETVGLWFLNVKMNYPPERKVAVNWVYQFSVASFALSMLSTPYRAIIIAKEKMKVFAYSSIVEAVLKLAVVFMLLAAPFDKLIYYALLMFVVMGGVSVFYYAYCTRFYEECRYHFYWDGALMKEIGSYTGWNVIGLASGIAKTQGVNLLLNLFVGPVANAAYLVASKVYSTINQFVTNFCTAFNPQITKSYSSGERGPMMKLVFQSSKFCYFLLFLLVLPLLMETETILDVWLVDVPPYAVTFTQLMLVAAVIDSVSYPFVTAVQATGKVKWYQLFVGGTMLMTLPIVYVMLKWMDCSAASAFWVIIICSVISHLFRIYFMYRQLDMNVMEYLRVVLLPITIVTVASLLAPVTMQLIMPSGAVRSCLVVLASVALTALWVYLLGLTKTERKHVNEYVVKTVSKMTSLWK